jgi:hypothetical protein
LINVQQVTLMHKNDVWMRIFSARCHCSGSGKPAPFSVYKSIIILTTHYVMYAPS